MRLIDTSTLKLKEFSEDSIPPYAILSHTWGNDFDELTFRQVENGDIDEQKLGSVKLRGCCQQAQKDGLGYAWIDTCCIDQTNLVELSEAINSMYRWYSRATVCYAYLSDVPDNDDPLRTGSKFRCSRWFQRGWTLQELLAPKHLRFYNSNWQSIGTKGTICSLLKNITRVPQQFLLGIASLHCASVAQRMSWAAQRQTKRAEDIAYCLLGIFGVTMPMIYGEGGEHAFFRLQEQIMKTTGDDSILAWGLSDEISRPSMNNQGQVIGGEILAVSPSCFANSAQIVARDSTRSPLHSLDVFGGSVRVHLPLLDTSRGETYGLLTCGPRSDKKKVVGIPLARAAPGASNEYIRPSGSPSVLQPTSAAVSSPELIHIKRDGRRDATPTNQQYWIIESNLFARVNLALVDVEPPSCWDEQMDLISALRSDDDPLDQIVLRFRHNEVGSRDFVMILEVTPPKPNTNPRFNVVTCSRDMPLLELVEKLRHISSQISGKTSASNGTLHLRISLDSIEERLTSINPHTLEKPPDFTVDVSASFKKPSWFAKIIRLPKGWSQGEYTNEEPNGSCQRCISLLELAQNVRQAIEDEIHQLYQKLKNMQRYYSVLCEIQEVVYERLVRIRDRMGKLLLLRGVEDTHSLEGLKDTLSLEGSDSTHSLEDLDGILLLEDLEDTLPLEGSDSTHSLEDLDGIRFFEGLEDTLSLESSEDTLSLEGSEGTHSIEG